MFGDRAPAAPAAEAAAAEAELSAAEPPQAEDDWADIANTSITAGRKMYIADAMVRKFWCLDGLSQMNGHAHTCVSSTHAQQYGVADLRRATGTRS